MMVSGAKERARELIVFCDGLDEAGLHELARRSRVVARDLLEALTELEGERSARRAIQEQRDNAVNLLGKRADDDLRRGRATT
jgi:hypothetical protein